MQFPSKSWKVYEETILRAGERRATTDDKKSSGFIHSLGFVDDECGLTAVGESYMRARFIEDDPAEARRLLQAALMEFPPAIALAQLLYGLASADRRKAEIVLRNQGFGEYFTDRKLGSLLAVMDEAEVIRYSKNSITVLVSPVVYDEPPSSAFVTRTTPFGNKVWLRRVLQNCTQEISWLDKHFMPVALEALWEACDGTVVSRVRVLSLRLEEHRGRRCLRQYRDLVTELEGRGISFEWRTIDSQLTKDTHDRWIIGRDRGWNVPNVNAIYTGQHSELHESDNRDSIAGVFDGYWSKAVRLDESE